MPGRNTNTPAGQRHTGWYRDGVNGRLEMYYNGTKVGHLTASGLTITDDTTTYMSNGAVQIPGLATDLKIHVVRLGSGAAVASNGANAIFPDPFFVATANVQIVAAWKLNQTASDVTVGTATSSASYRRFTIITNTAGTGSGTNIVASLNATASQASLTTRAFTTVASTVSAGAIVLLSHLTVGAATADGTDSAAGVFMMAYQYV